MKMNISALCAGLCLFMLIGGCSRSSSDDGLLQDAFGPQIAPEVTAIYEGDALRLRWSPVPAAERYEICLAREAIVDFESCDSLQTGQRHTTTATSIDFEPLIEGENYQYQVVAIGGGVMGPTTPTVQTANMPGGVDGLVASVDGSYLLLDWEDSLNATDYEVCVAQVEFDYVVECGAVDGKLVNTAVSELQYALERSREYFVRVSAVNGFGYGESSRQVRAAILEAPELGLGPMSGRAIFEWLPIVGATGYDLCVAKEVPTDPNACSVYSGAIFQTDIASPTILAGLENGTPYYVRLIPFNDVMYGPASSTQVVTPSYAPDTGVLHGAEFPTGNVVRCEGDVIEMQDCRQGRDASTIAAKIGVGTAGFDFLKLDRWGAPLSDMSLDWHYAGDETSNEKWSCLLDNHTGLTWQVWQTAEQVGSAYIAGNVLDLFSWYDPEMPASHRGFSDIEARCSGYVAGASECNSHEAVERLNQSNYCGFSDWRMPSVEELRSILNYGLQPTLDESLHPFANDAKVVWAADAAPESGFAYVIDTNIGIARIQQADIAASVLLVRGVQQ